MKGTSYVVDQHESTSYVVDQHESTSYVVDQHERYELCSGPAWKVRAM